MNKFHPVRMIRVFHSRAISDTIETSGGMDVQIRLAENIRALRRQHRFTQEQLADTPHDDELEPCGSTVLCVDAMLAGIGSNSCGPELMEKYRTGTKVDFTWTFTPEKIC